MRAVTIRHSAWKDLATRTSRKTGVYPVFAATSVAAGLAAGLLTGLWTPLIMGAVLTLVAPIRSRSRLSWPAVAAPVGFIAAFTWIAPRSCPWFWPGFYPTHPPYMTVLRGICRTIPGLRSMPVRNALILTPWWTIIQALIIAFAAALVAWLVATGVNLRRGKAPHRPARRGRQATRS